MSKTLYLAIGVLAILTGIGISIFAVYDQMMAETPMMKDRLNLKGCLIVMAMFVIFGIDWVKRGIGSRPEQGPAFGPII